MRTRFLPLLALGACAGIGLHKAARDDLLAVEGRVEEAPGGLGPAELARLPRVTVRGLDPVTGQVAAWRGLALAPLLTEELSLRRGADLVAFHGAGGRRAAVPLNAIRQSRPVLAEERDGKPLPVATEGYTLAWPDADAPGLATDPRLAGWWLGGVRRLEVLAFADSYGKALRVPAGAGDEARRGAAAFETWCMGCHRLRGTGGTAGPELTSLAAAADAARLGALLPGHLAARSGAARADPPAAAAGQIASLLRAISLAGPDRDDEVREPEPLPAPGQPAGSAR